MNALPQASSARRLGPSAQHESTVPPPVLWQFRVSHYNEKARWALDWKGIVHVRRSLLPGLHIPRMLWMTGQKALPALSTGGRTIVDSTQIIAALEELKPDPPLYPADPTEKRRALALEDFFDEELGPHLRRAVFHHLLPHAGFAVDWLTIGVNPAARLAYRALFPIIRTAMRLDMGIDEASAELGRSKIAAAMDRLEMEIHPSGYLVGDRFSVADLTAAALFAPLVIPPEFPYLPPGQLPEPAASYRASLAPRPGFAWVLETYRRHRGRSAELCA